MSKRSFRAAAVQFKPEQGNKAVNLQRLEALARQAAAGGAKLIVMPEMATIGLFWNSRDEIAPHVEPIPGETTELFTALARELSVYIAVGLGEVDPRTNAYYNAAALVGPEGLIGHHRKVHAYMSDPVWAVDGDLGFRVWETPLGKLGLMVCMDANYPESGRLLAAAGAEVLLMPVGWVEEICPSPLWIMRAFDNGLSAVVANHHGVDRGGEFAGGSTILDPDGTIQACAGRATADEIVYGTIDPDDPRRAAFAGDATLHSLGSRRPRLYSALALNRSLWNPVLMNAHFGSSRLPDGQRFRTVACEFSSDLPVDHCLDTLQSLAQDAPDLPHLFVLPELSFCEIPHNRAAALASADTIPGALTDQLTRWCVQTGHSIVVGLVEQDGGTLYNTIVLVSPDGVSARYRKTHLGSADRIWAAAGEKLVWADTPLGRIGLLTSTDLLFPEPLRCLSIEGADVVCVSSALSAPAPIRRTALTGAADDTLHWHLARTRAAENDVYVAFANRMSAASDRLPTGIFFGPVLFDAPEREALAQPAAGGALCAAFMEIDTCAAEGNPQAAVLRAKPGLRKRLPAQYTPLLACVEC